MSKRSLVKYLQSLDKKELEDQVLDLYTRFKPVQTYYNFVFNPKEDKLVEEAKMKIANEYFPVKRRKPRARRSVAQKYIKQFLLLGMDPTLIAEVMLFNLETAQRFNEKKRINQDAFYKSMFNSFDQAIAHIETSGLRAVFKDRILNIVETAWDQEWFNAEGMEDKVAS
ncbi:hypothetical protein BFP97_00960 [Roseivirga sp. 4D4]|uniref:DUF6155 family protein n=1 Tax=Roseivirga sp. 4D4 TaxID=1889784 RepID=UPI0008533616|nr:DUF6155 family protein [Roseivirga sp. 4D4]OEK00173.1 hypothetical protein BFP97_00960 [Roseivirga sp. 4D4]